MFLSCEVSCGLIPGSGVAVLDSPVLLRFDVKFKLCVDSELRVG